MRKALILAIALSVLFFTAIGCKDKGNEAGGSGATEDTVKLGLYVSTTGKIATFGTDTKNGVDLAVEEINKAGGIKGKTIDLRFYDAASKAEEAGNVATKLATQDKVLVAMGEVASGLSLAAAPVFEQNGIPMVSPSSTNPTVTQQGKNIFRICFLDDFQGSACAVFAYKELGKRKAAIIRNQDDPYSTGLADYFRLKFKALGGEIVADESYKEGTKEFASQITNVKAKTPDIIFLPCYYNDVALLSQQIRGQGIGDDVPMLGGDGWESANLIPNSKGALEGSYFGNHYSPEDPSEHVQAFVKGYKAKYNTAPSSLAALGYDVVYVVKKAIEEAGEFDRAKVRDALAALKDFKGVTGTFSIDEHRDARKPISILKIQGDKFLPVKQIQPQDVK
ncbi:MAG: ABC transporter substrate-binding protein [Planctomycetes bacterium]|nr:ABC transporter substrate-binding protein [Planctomycetota bacterium]